MSFTDLWDHTFLNNTYAFGVSIHRNYDQNQFIDEYGRRDLVKILLSGSFPQSFLWDVKELTFLIDSGFVWSST